MRQIPLTKGYFATVDDEDFDELMAVGKWQANVTRHTVYAIHSMNRGRLYMHRLLQPGSALVDHINGDGLDNRRENLRPATPTQNSMNMRVKGTTRTGYKGVSRQPRSSINPWRSYINVDGQQIWLGVFPTKEAAARAYDSAATEHFGDFARLNFPKETSA